MLDATASPANLSPRYEAPPEALSNTLVVVPWHSEGQLERFKAAWQLRGDEDEVLFQQDRDGQGCARTKNAGIEEAIRRGADAVVVLDDDCFPSPEARCLSELISKHEKALEPQQVPLFSPVSVPPSRGTPYHCRSIEMPVAASMGFWLGVGDYDAPGQLVHGETRAMTFHRAPIYGTYFPLSGMNLAFRAREWLPFCRFINVPRFDDIWMGWLWQKQAYALGYCFNLNGPLITHTRQSSVWANLREEAKHLEANETLWSSIASAPLGSYQELRRLLPR